MIYVFFNDEEKMFFLFGIFFQDRDAQKMQWINRFVEELKNDKWVLPALKQIREICQLFTEVRLVSYAPGISLTVN